MSIRNQIQYVKLDELIPYARNPRNNEDAVEHVASSIREFGFQSPIIVDKDNTIIAGHTRFNAAKRLKLDEVPIIKASDLTEAQVKAIINAAVSGTSTLTKSQVQAIVDAAQARNLTLAQVSKAIADATPKDYATLKDVEKINEANAKIVAAVNAVSSKALTEKQVEDIINAAVWNAGGVTKTWFDSTNYEATKEYTVSKPEEIAGLATLVNGGYDFEGKKIEITYAQTKDSKTNTIDLSATGNWTPIGNTRGNEFKGTIFGGEKGVVTEGLTLDEQFNAVKEGYEK